MKIKILNRDEKFVLKKEKFEELELGGIINVGNDVGLTIIKQGNKIILNIGRDFKEEFLK